jgi:peptide methionine sulfoxide reductase MsrA
MKNCFFPLFLRDLSVFSAIFYHNEEQHQLALQPKEQLKKNKPFKRVIFTEIVPPSDFFPAEDYHQRYYKKESYPSQVLPLQLS